MPKINYVEIIKRAWQIAWHNRYLWWFGLFLSLGSGGMGWNFNFPWYEGKKKEGAPFGEQDFLNFLDNYGIWILLAAVAFLIRTPLYNGAIECRLRIRNRGRQHALAPHAMQSP